MSKPRIIYDNVWRVGTAFNVTSEHPQFPATDTQGDTPSQFWRSRYGANTSGRIQIYPGNTKINFSENASELTATLTSGVYTGP